MKRANGTGSVSYLGKGRRKPYVARVSTSAGTETLGTYATRREAVDALEEYNAQKRLGMAPAPGSRTVTVGDCWNLWSARNLAGAGDSKRDNYEVPWRRRISKFADMRIRDVGVDDWQRLIDEDVAAGLAPNTITKTLQTIRAINRYAMERDYIMKDYSQFVIMPDRKAVVEKGSLTHEQIAEVRKLADVGDKWASASLILCYTGFRINELLPLTKEDLTADWILQGGEKTDAGRERIVPVCTRLRPYVETWLSRHGSTILCHDNGRCISYSCFLSHFRELMTRLGVPSATPHWTRYTFNTLCHEGGVDLLTQKWLTGHSTDADITHHYTKATVEQLIGAVERLWWPE